MAWARLLAGGLLALVGIACVLAGVSGPKIGLVGLGAAAVFVATVLLVPLAARPARRCAGTSAARGVRHARAGLGRENSMRNPSRTAQTAAALMIGIALVSTIGVLGASLSSSATDQIDSAVHADYIVTSSGGFSRYGTGERRAAPRGDGDDHRVPRAVRVPRRAVELWRL